MFLRLLRDSFLRRRRRKLLAVTALALGTAVTMASLSVALDIGDKVARELRSFGANILVRPQADTLPLEIGGVDLRPLEVRLPLAQVNDGNLHRFQLLHGNTGVRFIVIRRPDGQVVAALDACQICGPEGYFQDGANVVCKNCSAVIPPLSIGLPGGCNPIPINSRVEGTELVIQAGELTGESAPGRHH